MSQGFSLKDHLFNSEKIAYLGDLFASAWPGFDAARFHREVMTDLLPLELKQRQQLIARVLHDHLPADLQQSFDIIAEALPAPCDPSLSDDDFGDFIFAPLGDLVVIRGLEAPAASLPLLAEITTRFSMEFAIRPFLNHWEKEVLAHMTQWVEAPHYHLRRLVSEGTRLRLPWGQKIALDPLVPLPFLDQLQADPTRFVTRSVANHLNDLARPHPAAMMDRLESWRMTSKQSPKELEWLTKHALRNLIKEGDSRALELLGYRAEAPVSGQITCHPSPVRINEAVTFNVTLESPEALPVLVDYVLHFHRPDGKTGRKVFKLKQTNLRPNTPLTLTKSHRLKGNASTFTLHPGPHRVEVQVNGRLLDGAAFELIT